ncbi:MAG: DMT family transporter [Coriobacteriales bacterium]
MAQDKPAERPAWFYRLVLVSATLIWGGNFVISKLAVGALHPVWVIAVRFTIAGLLLGLVFLSRVRRCMSLPLLKAGLIIGFFSFLGYGSQFIGLSGTTPSKNAFLSACYCLTVPFIWWLVARRRPTARNLGAAVLCVAGMALVTLQGELSVSWGDGVSMLSALLYGAEIVAIALCVRDHDVIAITVVQMVSSGLIAAAAGLLLGLPFEARAFAEPAFVLQMAYIIVLGSCYASTAQNLAQTKVPPAQVSMLFALESVFGTVFSVLFLHEELNAQLLLGFALIFLAILVSELGGLKVSKEKAAPRG